MTEEFRAAFQRVLDTAASQAPDFPAAVHDVFRLSSQVPVEELATAMEALAPVLSDSEPAAGIAADLAVLAGALVESGAPAGQVGLEVLRQLGGYGQAAAAFMHAWDKTGGGAPPAPNDVSEADEQRVEEVLGDNAPLATVGWWTSLRYGLAAKAMLGDPAVRAAVRADSSALKGLTQIVHALSTQLSEFVELNELLRMAETDTLLVLDRASWRGFRVRFDGIGDNFQLHTLLADALIGKEGRRVPGTRPDPRWTAACLDAPADPLADVVRGEWDLVGGDGTWVGNEAYPGDVPVVDGERVLVLEPQSLTHSWRAGRRHPHITGSLEVVEELGHGEAAAWWARIHPAGAVRHPLAPPIEHDETGTHRAPRHFGVAAHFAEVDSGPMSAAFRALDPEAAAEGDPFAGTDPDRPQVQPSPPEPWDMPPEYRDEPAAAQAEHESHLWGTHPEYQDTPAAQEDGPTPWRAPLEYQGEPAAQEEPEPLWGSPPEYRDELTAQEEDGPTPWRAPLEYQGEPATQKEPEPQPWGTHPEYRDAPAAQEDLGPHPWADEPQVPVPVPVEAPGTRHEARHSAAPAEASAEAGQETRHRARHSAQPAQTSEAADDRRPGARLLPPMPPGVSDSWSWAPGWKRPAPPDSPS
ncbi:hypothetical protein A6A08_15570 [Nocardiopsis sp. TSRI0078]|uniref:hypothetical protein n=1 Tax=unclassified Nocardiopsis TaxID=2649073 RepID=UPI000939D8CA|nr:hypothetical protein [Nocardiopsis sp. TSRI0078]OKI13690.1 hypothetical protein A6A08_15570 [Nocardiopsis sp. TSRI0078]